MKKIQNEPLQILGIILTMLGLALIVRPLMNGLFGNPVRFTFFGIVPDGTPALVLWIVVLVIGLVLVSITKPLKINAKTDREDQVKR
jgi:hypothetical protein